VCRILEEDRIDGLQKETQKRDFSSFEGGSHLIYTIQRQIICTKEKKQLTSVLLHQLDTINAKPSKRKITMTRALLKQVNDVVIGTGFASLAYKNLISRECSKRKQPSGALFA